MKFHFSPSRFLLLILVVFVLLFVFAPAAAQDVTPTPDVPPVATLDLQLVIAGFIVYLLYVLSLAGIMQLAINQLKPVFLTPVKNRIAEDPTNMKTGEISEGLYLLWLYTFRTGLSAIAYFYFWGGIAATRATAPFLPAFIPDPGIAIGTIALVVLGEEVIHPILERVYILRDAAKLLTQPFPALEPSPLVNITVPPGSSADVKQVQENNLIMGRGDGVLRPGWIPDAGSTNPG